MIKRDDFIFTLGYQGSTAIVDRVLKTQYSKNSFDELLENHLFKPALAYGIYEKSDAMCEKVRVVYNSKVSENIPTIAALKKAFGVDRVPEEIDKVSLI
ncbi:MAG: hypothetical protein JXR70_10715 [Spirochaetales bacterium]|nr:hypothetical protein [Spirochaetales bacterium]